MIQNARLTNKDLLDLLVSRLSDCVVLLLDQDGHFRSWHPGVEKQLGYAAGEFIGQSGDLLLEANDRQKDTFQHELKTAAQTGRASDTTWLVTKSGHPIFVEGVSLALRDSATGELLGFGKVLHDITERKRTEDDLKALARTLDQSVVFIHGMDGVIEHWTSGCQRLYGWTEHEAVGRVANDLLGTVAPGFDSSSRQQLLNGRSWQGELQQKRKDGSVVYVSANWTMLSDRSDEQATIICTHTDITPRLEMQRELEKANERLKTMTLELERSNADLEEFARIASHDLSAPLTSARWLVDLLNSRHSQKLDADGKSCLQQITLGLARMTDLIEAILAHALVGKHPISATEPIGAAEALDMAIGNLQQHVNTSGATVTCAHLPKLLIETQPLTQLFQNLVSNAIKYRRPDVPPRVRIEVSRDDSRLWRLSVQDNGMGIEPEWLERIFQPLQRRHAADIAGSGIGLATCRRIVDRAGGRIWAESTVGAGSTFHFTLPGPLS